MESEVRKKYKDLTTILIRENITITTMESCTGGQISSLITDTEGSSAIMKGAFVTYSNEAKIKCGVNEDTIKTYGVYSKETAEAMAVACRRAYNSDIGIGITGSFGNIDSNNADSEPGKVYFAIATKDGTESACNTVPSQPSRLEYKLYMADMVADILLERISEK